MSQTQPTPDPLRCPLCGEDNACSALPSKSASGSCWCSDASIQFPAALLAKVATEQKGRACICKSCALKHQNH